MKYTATLSSQSPRMISVESEDGEYSGSFCPSDGRVTRETGNLPRGIALEALLTEPIDIKTGDEWAFEV